MIKKPTLFVLLGAILLGGAVYFFDWKRNKDEKPAADTSKPAFSIQASDVASLTLARPAKPDAPTVHIERQGDSWQIAQPLATGADSSSVDGIVDGVAGARVSGTEPGSADRLKAYGLDPPQISLEIQLRNGGKHTVLMGDKDFTGSSVYAIVDGGKAVSLLPDYLLTSSDKSLDDLRDHTVLRITSGQVRSFTRKDSSGDLAAAKDSNQWKFSKPAGALADGDAIDSLLGAITSARMSNVASEKPDNLGKYGLASPAVSFTAVDDRGTKFTLLVGKKDGDKYFARDASRPMVFHIDADLYAQLAKSYSDLRDKKPLHFDSAETSRVDIHNDHGLIVINRKNDTDWTIESPDAQKGKNADSAKIFDPLTALKADQVMDHLTAELASQLTKPAIEVTLTDKGGKKLTLRMSKPSGDVVYVQASDNPSLFKLKKQDFDNLNFEAGQILQ